MRFPKTAIFCEITAYIILLSVLYIFIFPISETNRKEIIQIIEDRQSSQNYVVVNIARIKQNLNMPLDFHDTVFLEHQRSLLGIHAEDTKNTEPREMPDVVFWMFYKPAIKFLFIFGVFLLVISKLMRLPKRHKLLLSK